MSSELVEKSRDELIHENETLKQKNENLQVKVDVITMERDELEVCLLSFLTRSI